MSSDERLSAIPDVGDPALVPAEEMLAEEVTPEKVQQLSAVLEAQNKELLGRLAILGRALNPLVLVKIQVDTMADFVFENDEARAQYETACSMRLNETLKVSLAELMGARVDG